MEIGPNERFANITNIKKARDKLQAQEDAAKVRQDAVDVEALKESLKKCRISLGKYLPLIFNCRM